MDSTKSGLRKEIENQVKLSHRYMSCFSQNGSKLSDARNKQLGNLPRRKQKKLKCEDLNIERNKIQNLIQILVESIAKGKNTYADGNMISNFSDKSDDDIDKYWIGKNGEFVAQNANRNRCTTDIAEAKSKKLHQQKSKFLDVCAKKQKAVYRKHLKFSADRSDEIDDRLKDLSELVNLKKQQLEQTHEKIANMKDRIFFLESRKEQMKKQKLEMELAAKQNAKNAVKTTN